MTEQKMINAEYKNKQARIDALLTKYKLDALLLQRVSSFAWATCGAASYINLANGQGDSSLLILPNGNYLITNNIEAPRLEKEENLGEQGWKFCISPWYDVQDEIGKLTQGLKLGADGPYFGATNLSPEIANLRAALTPEEGERFQLLGRICADAMNAAVRTVRPGQTEFEIAARLTEETECRGVQTVVNLIATDERISNFRHPLPTAKKLESYAMLILCGRQKGLICSITRFVHFGRIPEDIRRKANAVAQIDAILINATRPDRSLSEIFQDGIAEYAKVGYPNEWKNHHQGGLAGYEPREVTANPTSTEMVSVGQAFAWNPTIPGTKSEDTILVGTASNAILTAIPDWPTVAITIGDHSLDRPMILEMT